MTKVARLKNCLLPEALRSHFQRTLTAAEPLHLAGEPFEEAVANVIAQFGYAGVGDMTNDRESLLAPAHHPRLREGLHVAGDIRLGKTGGGDKLADIFLASFKCAQDFQSAWFREGSEPGGNHDQSLLRKSRRGFFARGHGGRKRLFEDYMRIHSYSYF